MKELIILFAKFYGPLIALAILMKLGASAYNSHVQNQYDECRKVKPRWECRTF